MLAVAIISLTMLGLSGLLIDSHRRTWREARDSASLSQADKQFARAMYGRRMQASGLVGLMGAAIGVMISRIELLSRIMPRNSRIAM